ncbi:acyltransferase [Bradyrhizobium jicamae]|uniref:acyltransferase family protein n=1 Tax=Bradyrhizobium jicamae TaxID=280332 RepID=UPI001BAB9921|nr:acyltransferase [Bradyrhizobium jicamae]MBR0939102.1 acyltransferase [Bradyrhizobium jicamae]
MIGQPGEFDSTRRAQRLLAVDGLRGILAFTVLVHHATAPIGAYWLFPVANVCVFIFFALSGYVLTRGWNGRFGTFLLRRFVRLWPVYAACLGAGYLIAGKQPIWSEFFWYPIHYPSDPANLHGVDPPSWSLTVEAWAMLFMPLIVWIVSGTFRKLVIGFAVFALAVQAYPAMSVGIFFLGGAALHRWEFQNRILEASVPQWLGKISYSLYLSHWLVLTLLWRWFGPWTAALIGLPSALALGYFVWRWIEKPSISASRRVDGFPRFQWILGWHRPARITPLPSSDNRDVAPR